MSATWRHQCALAALLLGACSSPAPEASQGVDGAPPSAAEDAPEVTQDTGDASGADAPSAPVDAPSDSNPADVTGPSDIVEDLAVDSTTEQGRGADDDAAIARDGEADVSATLDTVEVPEGDVTSASDVSSLDVSSQDTDSAEDVDGDASDPL